MADIDRFLRIREVEELVGLRKSSIYARIAQNEFPRPVPLGDSRNSPVGWPQSEIVAWQTGRLQKRAKAQTA